MALGPNSAKLTLSEHLPNRHVTVCRPSFHQSLQQLRLNLDLLHQEIDRQDSHISKTRDKLLVLTSTARDINEEKESVERPYTVPEPLQNSELISTLVVRRHIDRTGEGLRNIDDKYEKKMQEITAREDKYRADTIHSLKSRIEGVGTHPLAIPNLHESSYYIKHYCYNSLGSFHR